jgi:hypothetical protein
MLEKDSKDFIASNLKLNCVRIAVYAASLVQKIAFLPD